mmetsp:Transcript_16902/g.12087  ORF Transcript_16902/g.12087 Transcript_16902/m.12087 type:complete len:148 (+) Transcript_16902:69-512(+)
MSDIFSAENLSLLQKHGITHILTVCSGMSPRYPEKFTYLQMDAEDRDDYDLKPKFKEAIKFVDQALENGGTVLIHCAAGISRSGCMTCAYLMWKNRWTFEQAWEFGRSKREQMYPNFGFQKQLKAFERELLGYEDKELKKELEKQMK